jgi:hypothetical protein
MNQVGRTRAAKNKSIKRTPGERYIDLSGPFPAKKPEEILKGIKDDLAKHGNDPARVYKHVDGVELTPQGLIILYAPAAFVQTKRPDGGTSGPSNHILASVYDYSAQGVDVIVSKKSPPPEAAKWVVDAKKAAVTE